MPKILFKLIGVTLILASFFVGWFLLDYRSFLNNPMNVSEEGVDFVVTPGTSLSKLAKGMASRGLINNSTYLVLLGRWQGVSQKIKAGEFYVKPGSKPEDFLDMIVNGKVKLYAFTIVEGWSFAQLKDEISKNNYLEYTLNSLKNDEIMTRIGKSGEHPEGRFFPETYYFPRGTLDVDFLKRAYALMEERLQKEWEKRGENIAVKSPYEALILASIVEKETALQDEYGKIAGVFTRRLKKGMRLQTDPTVIYGIGESFDGNIRSRDLRKDTEYNTYTRKGLPPTPISMPGLQAIQAVLNPEAGEELYFVATGNGGHHFSKTLKEHNQAVIKYQLGGKTKSFSSYKKQESSH
jgi:UPF0755 protein